MRNEWNSNENESSPFPAEAYFVGVEPKEEMDNHLFDVVSELDFSYSCQFNFILFFFVLE